MTEETRREYARIVDDQQVARTELRWEVCNCVVPPDAGGPIEDQKARAATRGRVLRNQLIRQLEVEV